MAEVKQEAKKDVKEGAKPVKGKPFGAPKSIPKFMQGAVSKDFRGIIRLLGKDLNGHYPIPRALSNIRGIGRNLAVVYSDAIKSKLGIDLNSKIGDLSEAQLTAIEDLLKQPLAQGIPSFLLNKRKDYETGKDLHLLATDLQFAMRQDIQFEKDMKSWIGWRHQIGQKVRGQRTRTTGRSGLTVGVLKKAIKAQQAAAAAAPAAGAPAGKPAEAKK